MTIFYFTSTGNSLSVAKRIGGNLISIPQIIDDAETHYKDDVIGVLFPIYSLAAPRMVRRFLEKVKLEADYTFAVGTYGN
ncbi:MAG: 4Fe-4S ferredoxin, partial [Clostridiales bacterium]|nr:4Fe-4S ferredoxin [Clostridiales bacterium]